MGPSDSQWLGYRRSAANCSPRQDGRPAESPIVCEELSTRCKRCVGRLRTMVETQLCLSVGGAVGVHPPNCHPSRFLHEGSAVRRVSVKENISPTAQCT